MSKKIVWIATALAVVLAVIIGMLAPVEDRVHARATAEIVPASESWRAALPRDPEQATQAYLSRLSPQARARSDAYFEGGYWLDAGALAATLLATWLLLASRTLVTVRDAFARRGKSTVWQATAVIAVFLLLSSIWALPLDVYREFFREHAFGLANQSFSAWMADHLLLVAVGSIPGVLMLLLISIVLRRAPTTWWIWGSAIGIGFFALMQLIFPIFIQPLVNTYQPLSDARVKEPILAMTRANGVPASDVYQVDSSRQSNRISANVAGAFGITAIRLNDNLLNRTSLPEIEAVMGHELGHYVLNHIYKHILAFGLIVILGFVFLKWSYAKAIAHWGARFGIRDQSDPVGLPLFVALFVLFMYAASPLFNTQIRVAEEEADMFGLNASRQPDGFAEVNLKLTEYRKADPGPIEEFLFFDHPSPRKRIFAAMRWKAAQP